MITLIKNWLATIQQNHGVNPLIFGALYIICAIPFWFSIYKVIAGIKNKNPHQVVLYGIILAIAIVIPYLYVAVFGHNLPVWFWVLLAAILLYNAWSLLRKIRKEKKSPTSTH
jgi:predicted tellurium resistance membrane protein TerC